MHTKQLPFFAAICCLVAVPAFAQLTLPPASLSAGVSQQVGLTDVKVEYSSPAVKKRKIWGDVVAWDKPWRTGANGATKITFSKDVTVAGKPVPAGTYVIITHPSQKGWQLSLNKDMAYWPGNKEYDASADLFKVPLTAATVANRERLIFFFDNTTDEDTTLVMEWEKVRLNIPIKTETKAQALASIKATLEPSSRTFANAARYLADQKDWAAATKYIDQSIAMEATWYNTWIKADILGRQGKFAEARPLAEQAMAMGEKDTGNFFWKDTIAKALTDWKGKK